MSSAGRSPSASPPESKSEHDQRRLRAEYARRDRHLADSDRYSLSNSAYLFATQRRQCVTLELLRLHGQSNLSGKRVLEMGCGGGNILHEYLGYGAKPELLHGVDLLYERVSGAHARLPRVSLTCADGQRLPYSVNSFDLVLQYTALSSVLDENLRQHIADELLRVVKAGGMIIWYDFWLNPTNAQTHGIRPVEIRRLFPACRYDLRRVTLAPPITRRLVKLSRELCVGLESLRVFNSHYLAIIQPGA